MATLHTPDIHPVETFDPINNHTVEFSYTGSQIVRNRAIVLDNETYQTVYDSVPTTYFREAPFLPEKAIKSASRFLTPMAMNPLFQSLYFSAATPPRNFVSTPWTKTPSSTRPTQS